MPVTMTDHAEASLLLRVATPALYRNNLFRVLGVPVTATTQEVRRRQKRLDIARKLATDDLQVDGHGLLALRDPTAEDIRMALERLSEPGSRLVDELFWFWPEVGDVPVDPGLGALARGDIQRALDCWRAHSGDAGRDACRVHNRAVLNHLIALELDIWIASSGQTGLRAVPYADTRLQAQKLWVNAQTGWQAVLASDLFWSNLERRAEALADPQLTVQAVRHLREGLPRALLSINAQLALQAAERGDETLARVYVDLLRQGAVVLGAGDDAMRAVVAPLRHRIESLCEQARKRTDEAADQGHVHAQDLLRQVETPLRTIDLLLTANDVLRVGTHDAVAEAVLQCLILYSKRTEQWLEVRRLLDLAAPIAVGDTQRARLKENRDLAQRYHEESQCFFCGQGEPHPSRSIKVKMFGDVKRTPNYRFGTVEITWRHGTITVPRCVACADKHGRGTLVFWTTFFVTGLISLAVLAGAGGGDGVGAMLFVSGVRGLIVGVVARGLYGLIWMRGIRSLGKQHQYPAIRDLFAKGWQLGEKPNTAS